VVQQSLKSRHGLPTGPQAQLPPVQTPLQQSEAAEQRAPVLPQQWPFRQLPKQQSAVVEQAALSGAQQFVPLQVRPAQQSALLKQFDRAFEQQVPAAEHAYGEQQGAEAPHAPPW
jgi:hypothetical protein